MSQPDENIVKLNIGTKEPPGEMAKVAADAGAGAGAANGGPCSRLRKMFCHPRTESLLADVL